MPIDHEQANARSVLIGSSDAPAVCGVSSYASPFDVWALKTGRAERNYRPSEAARIGLLLEPALIQYAREELGTHFEPSMMYTSEYRCANTDAIHFDGESCEFVEAKTTGIINPRSNRVIAWGQPEEGIEAVPAEVLVQTHHAADVIEQATRTRVRRIHVPALIGGRGIVLYSFEPRRDIIDLIREKERSFYESFILPDIAPPNCEASPEIFRAMNRVEGRTISLPAGLLTRWRQAVDAAKAAEAQAESLANEVRAAMVDAEKGTADDGSVTIKTYKRKGYTVAEGTTTRMTYTAPRV
jgi:predicted phage-related endonuclease